jgi:hypothetical protein
MGAALAHAVSEIKKLTVKRVRIELAPVVHLAKQIAGELSRQQNKKSGYHHFGPATSARSTSATDRPFQHLFNPRILLVDGGVRAEQRTFHRVTACTG